MGDTSQSDQKSPPAGSIPKVRIVRCPKCRNLLTEFADVPLYQCGRCETVLRAKHWRDGLLRGGSTSGSSAAPESAGASPQVGILESRSEVGVPNQDCESIPASNESSPGANSSEIVAVRDEAVSPSSGPSSESDIKKLLHQEIEKNPEMQEENENDEENLGEQEAERLNFGPDNMEDSRTFDEKEDVAGSGDHGRSKSSFLVSPSSGSSSESDIEKLLRQETDKSSEMQEENENDEEKLSEQVVERLNYDPDNLEDSRAFDEKEDVAGSRDHGGNESPILSEHSQKRSSLGSTDGSENSRALDGKEELSGSGDHGVNGSLILSEQLGKALYLGTDGSEDLRALDAKEELAEPSEHDVVDEAVEMIDRGLGDVASGSVRSPSTATHQAYEGSVDSSDDGRDNHPPGHYLPPLSKRTLRSRRSSVSTSNKSSGSNSSKDMEEGVTTLRNNVPRSRIHERRIPIQKPSKERQGFELMGGYPLFEKNPSGVSDEFYSVQNFLESENDGSTYRGSSRGSRHDRGEILRKIEELKAQLIAKNRRPHSRVTRQVDQSPLFGSHGLEHDILHRYSSAPQHPLSAFGSGRHAAYSKYQHSHSSVSPQPNNHCRTCCQKCSHPRYGGLPPHVHSSSPLCTHNIPNHSHEAEMFHHKSRDRVMKRHCRPVLGGAHFITCYKCFKVLQMPEDFHFSMRRCNKLRCGACSKVVKFSVLDRTRIVPHNLALKHHPPSSEAGENSGATMIGHHGVSLPPDRAYQYHQGDPTSYSEEYEYDQSLTRSYSTDAEHVHYVSRDSSASIRDMDGRQPPLHSLMGYISASEIIYQQ